MDVKGLLVFVRVVQAGSFSKASRFLSMPKSTVSRKVDDLEEELGVPLLHRTTRSLRITDVGAVCYEHGLRIAAELDQADSLLTHRQAQPQGTLRVTAPTELGNQFLGKMTRDFLRANPKVSLDLVLTERVVDIIGEGFDVAIRMGDLEDSSLVARKIGSGIMRLYASPSYLKASGEPRAVAELEKHSCVIFTEEELSSKWILHGPKGKTTVKISGRISSNNMALIRDLTVLGEGVALMPHFFCTEEVRRGRLQPILKDYYFTSGPIHAVYPGSKFLQPKVRAFVDHLIGAFKDISWGA